MPLSIVFRDGRVEIEPAPREVRVTKRGRMRVAVPVSVFNASVDHLNACIKQIDSESDQRLTRRTLGAHERNKEPVSALGTTPALLVALFDG